MSTTDDAVEHAHDELTLRAATAHLVLGVGQSLRARRREPTLRNPPSRQFYDARVRRPIFVLGAPRSGTTFLGSCIGRLPDVSYHFEPRATKAAARCVYDGSWSPERGARFFRLTYGLLLAATLDGGRRFAEKNPENGFILPFLAKTFPDAQFVHIVRDGRDATVSHAEKPWLRASSDGTGRRGRGGQRWGSAARWWVEPHRAREFTQVADVVRSAWAWRRFTSATLDGLATLPAERHHEVRYESVVRDPGGTATALAAFLGAGRQGADALAAGLGTGRTSSIGRWRHHIDGADLALVEDEIGPLLSTLGYR